MLKKSCVNPIARDGQRARSVCLIISVIALLLIFAQPTRASTSLDVIDYDAELEPNLKEKTLSGVVSINFQSRADSLYEVELDAQELQVEAVTEGATSLKFEARDGKLLIRLERAARMGESRTLRIRYHAQPTRGLKFYEDHFYAAYNTPRWMVCNFEPGDRATLTLKLTLPEEFKVVANGTLQERKALAGGRAQYAWREAVPVPPYVYGFAAGRFQELVKDKGGVQLFYLARDAFTPVEVERIFADTSDMLEFFESRAGVPYRQKRYTQVLASGSVAQEMSGFTVIRESYGKELLQEPLENWLAAHEFAHQWWGIPVSCKGWADFWLNEGFAEFMMSAYRERRFGRDEYDRDMELARSSYARIRATGKDRPLAYRETIKESQAGGPVVYDKGALVLNLLRYELGDAGFWRGVRLYTRRHFGGQVETIDLRKAMEEASGKRLERFFEQWVYAAGVPDVVARHRVEGLEVVIEFEQRQAVPWRIPLQVAVETTRGRRSLRVELKSKSQEVRFRLAGELLAVRVDDGGRLPFRIKQEGRPLAMLLYQLKHEPDTAGRAEALEQIQALLASTTDEAVRSELKRALEERASMDRTRLIRAMAKKALEEKP